MRTDALLHVFRNTPFGRETFLQSAYFAKKLGLPITVYIPKHHQFLMYFERKAVTIDLDHKFLFDPKSALPHAKALINELDIKASFFKPTDFTALELPDIPVDFKFMCCPRSISDLSTKIGMGYIGPKVRQIIQNATFPVLIPTTVFKTWHRIVVFFGGSNNAIAAVKVALEIAKETGLPLELFTKGAGKPKGHYETLLNDNGLLGPLNAENVAWRFYEKGRFNKLLYEVPSDALAVVGAYGHGVIKDLLFGSKLEEIQTVLPNNILIIGPGCV
jgi:hypothetical protein